MRAIVSPTAKLEQTFLFVEREVFDIHGTLSNEKGWGKPGYVTIILDYDSVIELVKTATKFLVIFNAIKKGVVKK